MPPATYRLQRELAYDRLRLFLHEGWETSDIRPRRDTTEQSIEAERRLIANLEYAIAKMEHYGLAA
jgi:hypothetical protein